MGRHQPFPHGCHDAGATKRKTTSSLQFVPGRRPHPGRVRIGPLESHRPPISSSSSRPPQSARQGCRPLPYRVTGPCFRFNAGMCNSSNCRFDHVCSACSAPGHPEIVCPKMKGRARSRQGDTKLGVSPSRSAPAAEKAKAMIESTPWIGIACRLDLSSIFVLIAIISYVELVCCVVI